MEDRDTPVMPRLTVQNIVDKTKLSSNLGPLVIISNNKLTKQINVNTLNNSDVNVKSLLQSLSNANPMTGTRLNQNHVQIKLNAQACGTKFNQNKMVDTLSSRESSQSENQIITTVSSAKQSVMDSDSSQHDTPMIHFDTDEVTDMVVESESSVIEDKQEVILFKWGGVSDKPLHCQICDMSFNDGELLRQHVSKHETLRTNQKPFPCGICYKSFQTSRSLERHQYVHSGQTVKRCKFCYKIFANKENLDKHVLMHNGQKSFPCPICKERFAYSQGLESHILTHTKEKKFKCEICEKAFTRKDQLSRHLNTHNTHLEKKHKCVECDKSFQFLFTLRKHVRAIHRGESDGKQCEVCGKYIKNRENIMRHMMIHSDKRPHKCKICDRAFLQKQHLHDHMNIHSPNLSYSCKICSSEFRHRRSLNRHLHKHYDVSRSGAYVCATCKLEFTDEDQIRDHILTIHDKMVSCTICKKKIYGQNELAAHMIEDHSVALNLNNPKLVHKSTETNDADTIINAEDETIPETNEVDTFIEAESDEITPDTIQHQAAKELLRMQEVYPINQGKSSVVHSTTNERSMNSQEKLQSNHDGSLSNQNVSTSNQETLSSNSDLSHDHQDVTPSNILRVSDDGVVYVVCKDGQEMQMFFDNEQDFEKLINHANQSETQSVYISPLNQNCSQVPPYPECNTETVSQIIQIPENFNQTGTQVIQIPEGFKLDQTGTQVIQMPEGFDASGSQIIQIPEGFTQTGSQIIQIAENINQTGSQIINMSELANQSSDNDPNQENVDEIENPDGVEFSESGEKSANFTPVNLTDQMNYESNRSVLIQSLIDYAEKIQEEEMLVEESSETSL